MVGRRHLVLAILAILVGVVAAIVPLRPFALGVAEAVCTRYAPDTSQACGTKGGMVSNSQYTTPGYAYRSGQRIEMLHYADRLDLYYGQSGPAGVTGSGYLLTQGASTNYTDARCAYRGLFTDSGYCQSTY
jgi:hypothetical protein